MTAAAAAAAAADVVAAAFVVVVSVGDDDSIGDVDGSSDSALLKCFGLLDSDLKFLG